LLDDDLFLAFLSFSSSLKSCADLPVDFSKVFKSSLSWVASLTNCLILSLSTVIVLFSFDLISSSSATTISLSCFNSIFSALICPISLFSLDNVVFSIF